MSQLLLKIAGNVISVDSDSSVFLGFLREFLSAHVIVHAEEVAVAVRFRGFERSLRTPARSSRRPGEERLGYGIHVLRDRIRFEDDFVKVKVAWQYDTASRPTLHVEVAVRQRLHAAVLSVLSSTYRNGVLMEAYRKAVLWPLAAYAACERRQLLLHAALIDRQPGGVLLVGLGGVGKTSVVREVIQSGADARVLADNYVIVDEDSAFGVQEPLRFSKADLRESQRLIAQAERVSSAGGRTAVSGLLSTVNRTTVRDVVVVTLADKASIVSVTPESCLDTIAFSMLQIRELGWDSYPAVILQQKGVQGSTVLANLRRLLRNARCWHLTVGAGESAYPILDTVCK